MNAKTDTQLFNIVGNLGKSLDVYRRIGDKARYRELFADWSAAHSEWVRRGQPGLEE